MTMEKDTIMSYLKYTPKPKAVSTGSTFSIKDYIPDLISPTTSQLNVGDLVYVESIDSNAIVCETWVNDVTVVYILADEILVHSVNVSDIWKVLEKKVVKVPDVIDILRKYRK